MFTGVRVSSLSSNRFISSRADALDRVVAALNYITDPDTNEKVIHLARFELMTREWNLNCRMLLMNRFRCLSMAGRQMELLRVTTDRIFAHRKRDAVVRQTDMISMGIQDATQTMIINMLTTVDMWMPIIDELDANTASALIVAIKSSSACRGTEYAPILVHLHTRLPRLHIFSIPGLLPHDTPVDNEPGRVYASHQLGIGIAIVTSELRKNVREREAKTSKLVADALDRGQELDLAKNPHAPAGLAVHYKRMQAKEDLGYAPDEARVWLKDASLIPSNSQYRRVKDSGWKACEHVLSETHQLKTVDIGPLWDITGTRLLPTPEIDIKLVFESTDDLVNPDIVHGGMIAERWLMNTYRKTGMIELPTWGTAGFAQRYLSLSLRRPRGHGPGNYGALARFWSKSLSSQHDGKRFQIKATAKFRKKADGPLVTLEARSVPFVFFSCKRSKSPIVSRKRKPTG